MIERFWLILTLCFALEASATEITASDFNPNFVGGGTGIITRVFSTKMDLGESLSYLVDFKGESLVVLRNPGFPSPSRKVGDSITFDILRHKNAESKQPILIFVEEPNEAFQARYKKAAAKAPQIADTRPNIDVVIKEDGTFVVGGTAGKLEELPSLIKKIPKNTVVTLISHPESSYELTTKVLELLAAENIKDITFTSTEETL
ncbi:MAG: hypothetical protein K0R17_3964 [Rariglobus sp.]|jgi:biopolymer transport protein ExbD|nr:hypothetical protein [Rariglobus sp.]